MRYCDWITNEIKEQIIFDYVENKLSMREVMDKYNIKSYSYMMSVLEGVTRSLSESTKLARVKFPESFKHTDATRKKLSEARKNYLRTHPDVISWQNRKNPSYPEQYFTRILTTYGYDKKYQIITEYPVSTYQIDFAFVNEMVAVEIDGKQHQQEKRRISDEKKDNLLISLGWKVIRIDVSRLFKEKENVLHLIDPFLTEEQSNTPGMVRYSKIEFKIPVERDEFGYTKKQRECYLRSRKVKNRPTKEELELLVQTTPFTQLAKKYGVSDNAIRKWCKIYGLPYRRKNIK